VLVLCAAGDPVHFFLLVLDSFKPQGTPKLKQTQTPNTFPRAGTIPIVNRTGGLADTVRDVADGGVPEHSRNGFVLNGAANSAGHRAAALY
jgi:hypothetical protein